MSVRGPRHLFRHASAHLLEAFFKRIGVPVLPHGDFRTARAKSDWAQSCIDEMNDVARDVLVLAIADISALAGDLGALCLRETVTERQADLLRLLAEQRSDEDRGLLLWLTDRDVFNEAIARWFYQRRRVTTIWCDAYAIPIGAHLGADCFELRDALRPILAQYDAGMPDVAVEVYALDGLRMASGPATLLAVHYEGRWISQQRLKKGELTPVAARKLHHAAMQVEGSTGVLCVVSENRSPAFRLALANTIAAVGLGLEIELKPLKPVQYDLQRLIDPAPFRWDAEHNIEAVSVVELTLYSPVRNAYLCVRAHGAAPQDVRSEAIALFRGAERQAIQVKQGELHVLFGPREGRSRGRSVRIRFSGPHNISRNLDCAEEDLLYARYFERWKLRKPIKRGASR